jgi:4-azaleucine resistance transporter AzlC
VKAGWPVCLGYVPIGLAFGVLADQAGIPFWAVGMMSVLVFAGSAQFIAVAMLTAGASAGSIIATTFFVNLRHILMSSSLALYLHGIRRRFLTLFAYGITDESFAVNMARFRKGGWDALSALSVNQIANGAWIASTVCGVFVGRFIPRGAFGIDYALTGMFICLLVMQLQGRIYILTSAAAAAAAVLWYLLLPGNSYIVGASVCAATIGFLAAKTGRRGK